MASRDDPQLSLRRLFTKNGALERDMLALSPAAHDRRRVAPRRRSHWSFVSVKTRYSVRGVARQPD